MPIRPRYESFTITQGTPEGQLQGTTADGKVREFFMVVNRDLVTNELSLDVGRHYHDPTSIPWFAGSGAWEYDEMRGDD